MFANFTGEFCKGTGDTIELLGALNSNIEFSKSFADGDLVAYTIVDSAGTIKVAGVGTYVSAGNTITRNDTWSWDGATVNNNPTAFGQTLSGGTHTIRCDVVGEKLVAVVPKTKFPLPQEGNRGFVGDNILGGTSASTRDCSNNAFGLLHEFHRPFHATDFIISASTAGAAGAVGKIFVWEVEQKTASYYKIESVKLHFESSAFLVDTTGVKIQSGIMTFEQGKVYAMLFTTNDSTVRVLGTNNTTSPNQGIFGVDFLSSAMSSHNGTNVPSADLTGWESGAVGTDTSIVDSNTDTNWGYPIIGVRGSR